MADFKIDPTTGDLDIVTDLKFTTGLDNVSQSLDIRMRSIRGEWFADLENGIPYFESIAGQKFNKKIVASLFRDEILKTPGVEKINSLTLDYSAATRILNVAWECIAFGEVLTGSLDI